MLRRSSRRLLPLAATLALTLTPAAHAQTLFAPTSVWNTPLAASAPLDPNSAALSATLNRWTSSEISAKTGPFINTTAYSSSIYTVSPGQSTTNVVLDWWVPALNSALANVPIPATAQAAAGTDQHMVVYDPAADTMWEFWHMRQRLPTVALVTAKPATGGSLPAATYSYRVTALSPAGETTVSTSANAAVGAGGAATVTWRGIVGSTGYRIYRSATGGTPRLVGTSSAATTRYGVDLTFTDTGASTGAAAPTTNTADTPGVWHAGWAGRILNVSQSPGHYRKVTGAGGTLLEDPSWGSTASSLPMAAGMIRISDLQSGEIDHALQLMVPNTKAKSFVWPAQRTDGSDTRSDAIPEGARFRLDPNLDLSTLNLPPVTLMVARAAQQYGLIVNDRTLSTVAFRAEDPTPMMQAGGANPYKALFVDNTGRSIAPYQLFVKFPWRSLQLVAVPANPW